MLVGAAGARGQEPLRLTSLVPTMLARSPGSQVGLRGGPWVLEGSIPFCIFCVFYEYVFLKIFMSFCNGKQ